MTSEEKRNNCCTSEEPVSKSSTDKGFDPLSVEDEGEVEASLPCSRALQSVSGKEIRCIRMKECFKHKLHKL